MEHQPDNIITTNSQQKMQQENQQLQTSLSESAQKVQLQANLNQPYQNSQIKQQPKIETHEAIQPNEIINLDEADNQPAQDDNDSNWTDATKSIAPDDDDDIWVVDDDIIQAMEIDSGEEEGNQEEKDEDEDQQESDEEEDISEEKEGEKKKKKKKEQLDLSELEEQFVTGKQSNQLWRLGKHTKFCTSVTSTSDAKTVISGGGDDQMLCFTVQQTTKQWKQFYTLKHTQTVSKLQISHDSKYVLSMSENQIFCTQLQTQQSRKMDIQQQPNDMVCHKQGGVVVVAHGYTVSIYNLKGLDLFTSYTLDSPPNMVQFCEKGKQIVTVCENKLRIITPKNGEVVKSGGGDFHKEEISAMTTGNNMIFTGCIEGKVFATSLNKGTVMGQLEPLKGAINLLAFTDNNQYLMVAVQGDGLHWVDPTKIKTIFHNPREVSVTDIIQVHSPTTFAVSDLQGNIHIIDRRNPVETIKHFQAGNTIHKMHSRGSLLFAACEDGFVRVFDVSQ